MSDKPLSQRVDFRSLVDQLDGVAIWVVSSPMEYEYISDGFEDIWGFPAAEIKEDISRLYKTIHPDDRERVRSLIEESDQEPTETSYESRVVQPDGTIRWTHTRQFPIETEDGYTIVGISTDITEQKRREEELAILNRIVRHDIRNDMGIILGWAELLEDHVDDEGEPYLRRILTAGEHVVELTKVARDYAEAVTGQGEPEIHPVSLSQVLEKELTLRRESFPEAEFTVAGEIPAVDVAANEMLSSVFKNLLNNAVQHNDKDEPVVTVDCEASQDDVVVRVADNGPGIPEEDRDLIFEKGRKGLRSSGGGIGLYLVHTLVEQYGGEVWIEDNEPEGSVFAVRLPRAE